MEQVGGFPFGPHVVAEAVVAQADGDAQAQHAFDVGGADGIVHVAAGLVGDPGSGFFEEVHFGGVDVDAVGDDAFGA